MLSFDRTFGFGIQKTHVTGVGYDFSTDQYAAPRPCTFYESKYWGHQYYASPNAFVYIPRGVPSLEMELLIDHDSNWNDKVKIFTRGILTKDAPYKSREVLLGNRGSLVIPLEDDEDGGIAAFTLYTFSFPNSIPSRSCGPAPRLRC